MRMPALTSEFESFLSGIAVSIAQHVAVEEDPPEEGVVEAPVETAAAALVPPPAFLSDSEKVVWAFPDVASRLIEG